jgi:hypothetical protein
MIVDDRSRVEGIEKKQQEMRYRRKKEIAI